MSTMPTVMNRLIMTLEFYEESVEKEENRKSVGSSSTADSIFNYQSETIIEKILIKAYPFACIQE